MSKIVYNCQAAEIDIIVTAGDTLNRTFAVQKNGSDYNLDGLRLDMKIKRPDGSTLRTLSSVTSPADLGISGNEFTIFTAPIVGQANYLYDVQVTDGDEVYTIQKGKIIVEQQQT